MDWNHMHDWGPGMMLLTTVLWLGVVAAVAYLLAHWAHAAHTPARRSPSARELLDRRLADGDITPEEYRRRRAAMERPHRDEM